MNTTVVAGREDGERLHLELDGRTLPLFVRRRSSMRSLHTGNEIDELHAVATARDDDHDWISRTLQAPGGGVMTVRDENHDYAGHWQVSWNGYAESAGEHRYTLILTECEEFDLDSLVIGDLELFPLEYREEVVGEGLALWVKVIGTEDEVLTLRRMFRIQGELPVVRKGIHSEPRWMRLGLGEWAEREDRVEYRLVLVERGVDETDHPELLRILRQNNRAALGFYMNFAERLVDLMIGKGILTAEEVDQTRERASLDPIRVRNDFWRVVPDIEDT